MTEFVNDIAETIGAHGLEGAGALTLYWAAGPSLKNVGKAFGDWTDWRLRNLLKLGEKIEARRTATDDVAEDEGRVHPKVIHEVFERGSWTDDDVAQEYLAGLLMSARTKDGRDEGSAYLASIVAGLTAGQIRLHHAIYTALNGSAKDTTDEGLHARATARNHGIYIPWPEVEIVINPDPSVNSFIAARDAIDGLAREGLIDDAHGLASGRTKYLDRFLPPDAEGGLLVYPSSLGIEVFLRAHNFRLVMHNQLLLGLQLPQLSTAMPVAPSARTGIPHP